MNEVIWIAYTTLYREGGDKFECAAALLEAEKKNQFPECDVENTRVESKKEFCAAIESMEASGRTIRELHFIGHSGMYGIMFGTRAWPEQMSPYEWKQLKIPFAKEGSAYFHACRTARWFAPFFARTFGVPSHGYHWYTTVSKSPTRFRWEGFHKKPNSPVYIIGCPGKKSHGLSGSLLKYTGLARAESFKRFEPLSQTPDETYDAVSKLYDAAFDDIKVRKEEVKWIQKHLPTQPRLLEIGCGNGALLQHLSPELQHGIGVDESCVMIEIAQKRNVGNPNLSFLKIDGPSLPFSDQSVDVVLSMLSFRYLDWDPIMREICRVLVPGGRLLIVDMIASPLRFRELVRFGFCKAQELYRRWRNPTFRKKLRELVENPAWKTMLQYNPIRAEHEMKWYLESRFPPQKIETIQIGFQTKIFAFDSGPLTPRANQNLSYP